MEVAQLIVISLSMLALIFNGVFFALLFNVMIKGKEDKETRQKWKQQKREIKEKIRTDRHMLRAMRRERKRNLKIERR